MGKRYPVVSDFGLSQYVGKSNNDDESSYNDEEPEGNGYIFGVIPYIAPEVLRGHQYTPASDIYSFGMIMYELLTGHQPFDDAAHDLELIARITAGNASLLARPTSALDSASTLISPPISSPYKTTVPSPSQAATGNNQNRPSLYNIQYPKCWIRLMYRCWNDDPTQRPNITELNEVLEKWYQLIETNVAKDREDLEILRDFRDAENFRVDGGKRLSIGGSSMKSEKKLLNTENREKHPEAFYYSRKIPTKKLMRKLEEQMGAKEIRDYLNLKYLQKYPSIESSSNDLEKGSLMSTSVTNNSIPDQHSRQSGTSVNTTEGQDAKGNTVDGDNMSTHLNLGKGLVGGVLEMLRDDGSDGMDTNAQKNGSFNAGFNNNIGPSIKEDENKISSVDNYESPIIEVQSYDDDNISRNDTSVSYFREYPSKNSLTMTQSYNTLVYDYSP
ncbi:13800_t:CDS:2 [Acaulospora colombiana]|uniref:13800_t:CDS:1 n=1 Tax=Acaulospora colombiana TaxID=27376 RepID=A0ACA9M4U8_9GLOM|nr:13800_t:CDS:2 [Acaulospora colombiana]